MKIMKVRIPKRSLILNKINFKELNFIKTNIYCNLMSKKLKVKLH